LPGGGGGGGAGGGGGGGAATSRQPTAENVRTGWSSIPFGATPRWPCLKSKKPTPVTVAVPVRLVKPDRDCVPHARSKVERARWIRRAATEWIVQPADGNSAIIVRPVVGLAITRCTSPSDSIFAETSRAFTWKVVRSIPPPRSCVRRAGARCRIKVSIVERRVRRLTRFAAGSVIVLTAQRCTPQARAVEVRAWCAGAGAAIRAATALQAATMRTTAARRLRRSIACSARF